MMIVLTDTEQKFLGIAGQQTSLSLNRLSLHDEHKYSLCSFRNTMKIHIFHIRELIKPCVIHTSSIPWRKD